MSKPSKDDETYTVLDHLFKVWLDQYPPEKTTALQERYLFLDKTIRELNQKYITLETAKDRLSNLWQPLSQCLGGLQSAAFARNEFIAAYGDLGITPQTPYNTIAETIKTYGEELQSYGYAVEKTYLSNLDSARKQIDHIYALRNLYADLFKAITTIRDSYFKTEPNRRKPIIRDLYRIFNSIGSNHSFFGAAPTIEDSLISPPIDKGEWDSLLALRREAEKAATVIKSSR